MKTLTAVLLAPDRAVAMELSGDGTIVATRSGANLREAVAALEADSRRIVVADAREAPVAAAVGVVDMISAQSAARALGLAGCAVAETITINDHRDRIERIRALVSAKPEIILLAGGTTEGNVHHLEELSNVVARARDLLEPVLGFPPVVLFAGNPEARELAEANLEAETMHTADNVRPSCEEERLEPAVLWASSLAPRLPVPEASDIRPAGAARSLAVRDLAQLFKQGVLLLWGDGENAEAISLLDNHWNRVSIPGGTLEDAVALHRKQARELSGVPLMREISDAFGGHSPGRDLLDVASPGVIVGAGRVFDGLSDAEVARRLVELARPRGVVRLVTGDGDALTLLGLTTLLGGSIEFSSYHQALRDVALVVSVDGRGRPVRVDLPGEAITVEEGTLSSFPIAEETEVGLDAQYGGSFGPVHGRRLHVNLPPLPGGLLIDARGTPVAPERRVRILPRR